MRLNRGIIILVCLCLGAVGIPWSMGDLTPSAGYAATFDLMPEGTRRDTLEWTKEYMEKIAPLDILEERDTRDAFQLVKRGDFVRWLVRARNLTLKESEHQFDDVNPSDPNYPYIMTALKAGIIEKTETFRPKDPILRADAGIWLVNAHGDLAKKRALEYTEPLIPAQDGYDGIPDRAVGALSVCYSPEYQMMEYRHIALDDFRYVQAGAFLLTGEAAYSLYQLVYPPQRGGELRALLNHEPRTLFTGLDTMYSMTQVTATIYEGASRGSDAYWANFPTLIKRIPTLENGLWIIHHDDQGEFSHMELTFELRKGLKWSDGSPLTADDFVFGHYLYNHPTFPTWHSEIDFWLEKVEALDDFTIKSTWNNPYLFANNIFPMPRKYFEEKYDYHLEPYDLNNHLYYIPPSNVFPKGYKSEKFLQDEAFLANCAWDDSYNTQPLHAGPYRIKEWNWGNYILLEPNEHYLFGAPLIEEIEFSFASLLNNPVELISNGQIELALDALVFNDIEAIKEHSKEVMPFITPSLTWEHLDLNVDDEIFSDIRVRHALIHGMNREKLIQDFFRGEIDVAHAWFPKKHSAYDETKITKYKHDINKSEQLLDEAGWIINPDTGIREKDGQPLEITFITTAGNRQREETQASIASDWEDIGIDVYIKNEGPTSFFTTRLRERKFDGPTATMYAWIMGPNSNLAYMLHSKYIPAKENNFTGQNYTGFQHDLVDQYIERILSTLNKSEVYSYLTKIQTIVTHELPSLPLYFRPDITAVHRDLAMYKPSGTLSAHTWNIANWYWKSDEASTLYPKISFTPKSLNFFDVAQGFKSSQKVTITNDGANLLTGSLHTDSPCLSLDPQEFSLEPQQSLEVQVILDPGMIEEAGAWSSIIEVLSNDPEHPSLPLSVQANLLPPQMELSLDTIDFGNLSQRKPAQISLDIANTGGKALNIVISSPYPALQLSETQLSILPRSAGNILLSLDLSLIESYGSFESILTIESNDPEQSQVSIPFKGSYGVVIQLMIDNPVPTINGEPQYPFELPPFIHQGRTLVPIRFIAEAFGAEVEYITVPQEIQIRLDLMRIRIWINNPKALIEPIPPSEEPIKEVILDAPPIIRYARSFVPIRFISEAFGATVEWEASTQTITIYYKEAPPSNRRLPAEPKQPTK